MKKVRINATIYFYDPTRSNIYSDELVKEVEDIDEAINEFLDTHVFKRETVSIVVNGSVRLFQSKDIREVKFDIKQMEEPQP